MRLYLRPGAYTERVDAASTNQTVVRTDIVGFIGIAEKGPLDTPVPVESFRQFQAHFGDFIGMAYLAYAVRAFFENGGKRCWVIRIASKDQGLGAKVATHVLSDGTGEAWLVKATNPGTWGNQLAINLIGESRAQAAVAAGDNTPLYARVSTVAGFARGELVCIGQEDSGATVNKYWRVLSYVDPLENRLYWRHPEPGQGLPYDRSLTDLDPNRPATIASLSYRLTVTRHGRLLANYFGLSLIPEHNNFGPRVLAAAEYPIRLEDRDELPRVPAPVVIENMRPSLTEIPAPISFDSTRTVRLMGGTDGLGKLSVNDFIGQAFAVGDNDATRATKSRGIEALNRIDEIAIVAVPDIVIQPELDPVYDIEEPPEPDPCLPCPPPPEIRRAILIPQRTQELPPIFSNEQIYQVQSALVQHCESRGDRFAILDPPFNAVQDDESGIAAVKVWRSRFDTTYAALYYPWIKVVEPRRTDIVRAIPPSGHAAGQYALHDNETGVHRAPANSSLTWAQDLTVHASFGEHEILNPLGINLVRSEGPRGIRIMGARTLSSDPDWRYINVRRLLLLIRKTIDIISQWVVFEPNHAITRNKYQVALRSYLTAIWARGALVGTAAEEAFFVKCDEENNPDFERNNGRLLAEIGVAPSKPFEFVVVRVGVQDNELEISEPRNLVRAA